MYKPEKLVDTIEHTPCDKMAIQLRIEVRLPEGHWSGDVSRERPEVVFRIEETMPLAAGRGTARIGSSGDVLSELQEHNGVDEVRHLGENRYEVDIARGGGGFIKPLREAGVIPQSPFEVRDGWVDWMIECSAEKSRHLVSLLRESEIPYRVISTKTSGARMLTPRQRVVFDAAMHEGYWDSPRRITLSNLANLLGVAKSTLSVQLHSIEGTVMNSFAEDVRRRSP